MFPRSVVCVFGCISADFLCMAIHIHVVDNPLNLLLLFFFLSFPRPLPSSLASGRLPST